MGRALRGFVDRFVYRLLAVGRVQAGRELAVEAPAGVGVLLCERDEPLRLLGMALSEHLVARLELRVALEGDARRLGVETEGALSLRVVAGVVAEERPVAA